MKSFGMRPDRRTQGMGNDLTTQTKSDCWNIAGNALLSPADFAFQPGITVRVPVYFVFRFASTIDYGNRNRVVGFIQWIAVIDVSPVEFITKLCQMGRCSVLVRGSIRPMWDQYCPCHEMPSDPSILFCVTGYPVRCTWDPVLVGTGRVQQVSAQTKACQSSDIPNISGPINYARCQLK